jgi:hypothetical protein
LNDHEREHLKITEVKIADIVFAFNNTKLIELLRKRGGFIMNQKYDEMRATEAEISQLTKEEYETFTRPVCAFIIFEEEDGSIIANESFEPEYNWNGDKLPAKA